MKKLLCCLVTIILALGILQYNAVVFASAADLVAEEEKIEINVSPEMNFADNRVLVVMNHESSLNFTTYAKDDFSVVNCTKVTDLSDAAGGVLKARMEKLYAAAEAGALPNVAEIENATDKAFNINTYQQVLCLELDTNNKENVLSVIEELMKHDDVMYAGPDFAMELRSSETSTNTLSDPYDSQQWAADKIDLPEAWTIETGSANVVVGIIDTGIAGDHPDLVNRIDKSLCCDFSSGSAVMTPNPTDISTMCHGTQMAGIIGAEANNGIGISGVCQNVTLVSLKVADFNLETRQKSGGHASHVMLAVNYAAANGIDILNFSMGWTTYEDETTESNFEHFDYALQTVISQYPGLFVCATGEHGFNNDTNGIEDMPSNMRLSNLISVGASTSTDGRWYNSNYGKVMVDIFAPGVDIYSTFYTTDHYGWSLVTGTSPAAAYVTGVAALLLSAHPDLTPYELKMTIQYNVDISGAFEQYCVSGGQLNAYKALTNIRRSS